MTALLPAFDAAEVQARLFVPGPGPLVDVLAARGFRAETGAPTRKLAWSEARALATQLRGHCDVLHAHGPRAAYWSAAVARWARIPKFVCTLHELRWRSLPPGPKRMLWVALESWALHRADRSIVLSRESARQVGLRFPRLEPRLRLVRGATSLLAEGASLPRATPGLSVSPLRVIAIGRFHPGKRHDRLLTALALAVARGIDLELHLAGDGPERAKLESLARSLGIWSRVRWIGESFDVAALLSSGHVYASASLTEACSVAAMEAMAIGLPIVTSQNGGVSELVEDGDCGRVVRATDEPAMASGLADALVEMASDPALRARAGEAAAAHARQAFTPHSMARATTAVYRGMFEG